MSGSFLQVLLINPSDKQDFLVVCGALGLKHQLMILLLGNPEICCKSVKVLERQLCNCS